MNSMLGVMSFMSRMRGTALMLALLGLATGCGSAATEPPETSDPIPPQNPEPADLTIPTPAPTLANPAPSQSVAPAKFDPAGLNVGPGSGFIVLDDPSVVPGSQATWLNAEELVLGVTAGGAARAYPISQMAYHHIANDQINGEPYLVTY